MPPAAPASSAASIEKLDASLGAVVHGIDLREPLGPDLVDLVRSALFDHQVLFFRNQTLSDDQHIQFAEQFGTPCLYPIVEMLGGTKTLEIVADGGKKKPVAGKWHTDVTWLQDPPKLGVLNAQVMPEHGGDTLWCSLYSVYEALPEEMREKIEALIVAHSPGAGFYANVVDPLGGDDFLDRFKARYGEGSRHELVRDHYVTGRRLVYLAGAFMDHVEGMDLAEGRALLDELMAFASDEKFHVRWDWQVDDLAIWDERSTMHRVDASHWPELRTMRRCTMS
jgi:taurine dioxygenase